MLRVVVGIASIVAIMIASPVRAADRCELTVFGAGSLREVLGAIAQNFGAAHGTRTGAEFGPSGRMRERIERGERVDLFASADVGHACTLVENGLTSVMAVFALNTICVLAPLRLGLAEDTIVDKLLDKATRISISPPKETFSDWIWGAQRDEAESREYRLTLWRQHVERELSRARVGIRQQRERIFRPDLQSRMRRLDDFPEARR
jgi:hypothetical protein